MVTSWWSHNHMEESWRKVMVAVAAARGGT